MIDLGRQARWACRFRWSRRRFVPGLLALGAAGMGACASPSLIRQPWVEYRPPLWLVQRDGRTVAWLFGSLHIGREAFQPWPAPVEQAWRSSDAVALELDVPRRWDALVDAFRPRVHLPENLCLEDLLPPDTVAEARRLFGWDSGRWAVLRRRQPWWVANFAMTTPEDRAQDASRRWGTEGLLVERLRRERRPLIELETVIEAVDALAGGPLPEQAIQFQRWLDLARWRGQLVQDMVVAWQTGDVTSLGTLKDRYWGEAGGQDRPLGGLRERFFTARDARMARRLLSAMRAPDPPETADTADTADSAHSGPGSGTQRRPVFVTVGAFHLVGPDSLVVRLRDSGCRVIDATGV